MKNKNLAYITLLVESNNEDDFENKIKNDRYENITQDKLDDLLYPEYVIRGFVDKTAIHYNDDIPQYKKLKLTKNAYQKHLSKLNNNDF